METSTSNDARRERKKTTDAALYLKNVASGKQKLYQMSDRDRKRTASIRKKLPKSKRHLLKSVLERLSAEIKAGKKSSPRLIESSIYKCERECERSLAASASGRSDDDNAVSSTNAESGTATSMEDTPAHASANQNADAADQSTPPTARKAPSNVKVVATPAAAMVAAKSNLHEILGMLRSDDEDDDEDLFE